MGRIAVRNVSTIIALSVLAAAGCQQVDPPAADAEAVPVPAESPTQDAVTSGRPVFSATEIRIDRDQVGENSLCALRVNGERLTAPPPELSSKDRVSLSGWLGDDSTKSWPADRPMLLLEHATTAATVWQLDLPAPLERLDAARKLEQPSMQWSGFDLEADLSGVPGGNYRLYAAYYSDGKLHVCHRGGALKLPR